MDRCDVLDVFPRERAQLLPALHAVQHAERWLAPEALAEVAAYLRVPVSEVWGVATHYPELRLHEPGRVVVRVCTALACAARGGAALLAHAERALGTRAGSTSADSVTLEAMDCAFACALAPVVCVERRVIGRVAINDLAPLLQAAIAAEGGDREVAPCRGTAQRVGAARGHRSSPAPRPSLDTRGSAVARLAELAREHSAATTARLAVAVGTCGAAVGAERTVQALRAEAGRRGSRFAVTTTACAGLCWAAPAVTVFAGGAPVVVPRVTPADARAVFDDAESGRAPRGSAECAEYLALQRRVLMRDCGVVDPSSLGEALARGRYAALARALDAGRPDAVIDAVKAAALAGRGGAYFPTAVKWAACRAAPGEAKYVVVNAEEGEPGVFKDRHLMEGDPHRLLEGTLLAAFAVGASHGVLYVHGEADASADQMSNAIDASRAAGIIGPSVLGTGFAFDVELRRGAGGFVLGEETALLESLEGRRAMPRTRPPFPAEAGLFGKPTVINNVETLCAVVSIVGDGPAGFAALGGGAGTKIFALSGHVKRPGVVELEAGTTLTTLLARLGGGSSTDAPIGAAVLGGPSGVVVSPRRFDDPLVPRGALNPGTGGVVALDERVPVRDAVRTLLAFNARESCGKCTPCREGTARLLEMLEGGIDDGRVKELAEVIQLASLCGLGQAAPLSVLSALAEFPDALEARR